MPTRVPLPVGAGPGFFRVDLKTLITRLLISEKFPGSPPARSPSPVNAATPTPCLVARSIIRLAGFGLGTGSDKRRRSLYVQTVSLDPSHEVPTRCYGCA